MSERTGAWIVIPGAVLVVEVLAREPASGITGGGWKEIEDPPDIVRGRV